MGASVIQLVGVVAVAVSVIVVFDVWAVAFLGGVLAVVAGVISERRKAV